MGTRDIVDLGTLNKQVSFLAIAPQGSSITRVGRQAYNSMLQLAMRQIRRNAGGDYFEAPLSEILTGFAAAKDAAKEVKRHLVAMVTTAVHWQSPSPAEPGFGVLTLLAEGRLVKRRGENWMLWAYAPAIRREIELLATNDGSSRFAQISMTTVAQLRTHAAIALYEICARYRDNPTGVTSRQHWSWWLPVLTGTPAKDRKTQYRFFKRDYIKPAIDDINEISELRIDVIEFKRGRAIEDIQFSVSRKVAEHAAGQVSAPVAVDMSQIVRAQALGVAAGLAEELQFRHGIDTFRAGLNALERRQALKSQEPLGDPVAYLRTVLKNAGMHGPAPAPQPQVLPPAAPPGVPATPVDAQELRQKEWHAKLRTELEALHPQELESYLSGLRQALTERGGLQSLIKRIDAGNWKSPLVLYELIAFYAKANYGHDWKDASADAGSSPADARPMH